MVDIPTVPLSDDDAEDRFETMHQDSLVQLHRILLEALQDVAEGVTPNLMVLMPPGSAKSTYVDVVFVPWFLAKYPNHNVILTSYGTGLAKKQGRRARQLIRSIGFQSLFGVEISADSAAADEWSLTNGSEYMAGGILSGITGNRADLGIVDDPVKGREDADSETIRQKTREAYEDDFVTRLKPGGRQVMITTRWHQDDLAGGILPEGWDGESGLIDGRDGRVWRVLCIPAMCERADDPLGREIGEYLWPEWFTEEHWAPLRQNQRTWSALCQQRPAPAEGIYFKLEWFHWYEKKPEHLRIWATSDYAVKDGGGDFTEHAVWGIDPDSNIYLLDGWYGQTTSDIWIEEKIRLIKEWKPIAWFGEAGQIRRAIEPFLKRRMRETGTHCRIEWIASTKDKPTRARAFQARAAMGKVYLPNTAYGHRALDQLLKFPTGGFDDFVDTASLLGSVIDQAHPAYVERKTPKPKRDRYDRDRSGGTDWMIA